MTQCMRQYYRTACRVYRTSGLVSVQKSIMGPTALVDLLGDPEALMDRSRARLGAGPFGQEVLGMYVCRAEPRGVGEDLVHSHRGRVRVRTRAVR